MIDSINSFVVVQKEMGLVLFDMGLSEDVEAFLHEPLREAGEVLSSSLFVLLDCLRFLLVT